MKKNCIIIVLLCFFIAPLPRQDAKEEINMCMSEIIPFPDMSDIIQISNMPLITDKDVLIGSVHGKYKISRKYLTDILGDTCLMHVRYTMPSPCGIRVDTTQTQYKPKGETYIDLGINFYIDHKEIFEATRRKYPLVDTGYILAILRKETIFNLYPGEYHTLPLLYQIYTQAENAEKRESASYQIGAFLEFTHRANIDPYSIIGSKAGAIGFAQFLPVWIKPLGVDGNGDGIINLMEPADAIPSIARHLYENTHHWRNGRKEKAIQYYNPDKKYVAAVMYYAQKIQPKINNL